MFKKLSSDKMNGAKNALFFSFVRSYSLFLFNKMHGLFDFKAS